MESIKQTKQLTLISLLSGIAIIIFILGLYLPFFSFALLIILPFNATITYLQVNKKYLLIYIVATLLITLLINFQESLFYVFPALISGITFGICIKKNLHGFLIVLINAIVSISIQYFSLGIIYALYNVNMNEVFALLFNLEITKFNELSLVFYFVIGLIQMTVTYFVIEGEIKKFKHIINETYSIFYPILLITFFSAIGGLILLYINKSFSYFLTCISLLSSIYLLDYIIHYSSKIINFISLALYIVSIFLSLFITSEFQIYSLIFNIFSITTTLIGGIVIIDSLYLKKQKITINSFNKINKDGENII